MIMIYAQIKNGFIMNIIYLLDTDILSLFYTDPLTNDIFDYVIRIDNLDPQPCIGWTYDGENFYPPNGD